MTDALHVLVARQAAVPSVRVETRTVSRPAVPHDGCRRGPDGRQLWVIGLPVSTGAAVDSLLQQAVTAEWPEARRALTALDGAFAAFLWDERAGRLLVVNDFAGFQPVYMRRGPGTVAFAPRIDTLAAGTPDPAGWGAFIGYGSYIGPHTSAEGVARLPPAQVIEYDARTDRLTADSYWQWPAPDPSLTLDAVDTGELLALLEADLRRYDGYGVRGTLLLSGGFESRLTAALLARSASPPTAMTLPNPYEHLELEARFATRVARLLGLRHDIRRTDPDFFSTPAYLEYVAAHEIAAPSVNLFIAQVSQELQAAGVRASWDGVPFGALLKVKTPGRFDDFLKKVLQPADGARWCAARQVFAPGFVDAMRDGLHEAIRGERRLCHDTPDAPQQFNHRNRIRHRIAPNTLKVYSMFSLQFLFGLTREFYDRVVPIPTAVRDGDAIYYRMFARHLPELARLPWCSSGRLLPGTRRDLAYRALSARSALLTRPGVSRALGRLGAVPARTLPACVQDAVRQAPLDDAYLHADGVRALQRHGPTGALVDSEARELVFYWTRWRAMMPGSG